MAVIHNFISQKPDVSSDGNKYNRLNFIDSRTEAKRNDVIRHST